MPTKDNLNSIILYIGGKPFKISDITNEIKIDKTKEFTNNIFNKLINGSFEITYINNKFIKNIKKQATLITKVNRIKRILKHTRKIRTKKKLSKRLMSLVRMEEFK